MTEEAAKATEYTVQLATVQARVWEVARLLGMGVVDGVEHELYVMVEAGDVWVAWYTLDEGGGESWDNNYFPAEYLNLPNEAIAGTPDGRKAAERRKRAAEVKLCQARDAVQRARLRVAGARTRAQHAQATADREVERAQGTLDAAEAELAQLEGDTP